MTIPTGSNLLATLPKTTPVAVDAVKGGSRTSLTTPPVTPENSPAEQEFRAVLNNHMTASESPKNAENIEENELSAESDSFCCVHDVAMEAAAGVPQVDSGWMHGLMPFLPESNELKAVLQGDVEAIDLENELPLGQMIGPALSSRSVQGGDSLPLARQTASVKLASVLIPQTAVAHSQALPVEQELVSFQLTSAESLDGEVLGEKLEQSLLKPESFKSIANEFNLAMGKESLVPVQQAVSGMSAISPTATAANLTTPVTPEMQLSAQLQASQWGDALGEKVAFLISHRLNKAEIRIDPPHLGKLDIQIQIKDDSATVVIHTQHAQTRDMIESASARLREFLQEAGYTSVNVDVSQREQSFSGDLPDQQTASPEQQTIAGSAQDQTGQGWQQSMVSMSLNDGRIDYFA